MKKKRSHAPTFGGGEKEENITLSFQTEKGEGNRWKKKEKGKNYAPHCQPAPLETERKGDRIHSFITLPHLSAKKRERGGKNIKERIPEKV